MGWLLPLAYPVLGFLLLLPRGDHGPLQLEDTWGGGEDVAADGDPHTKQGSQSGSKLEGLYQLVAKHPHPKVSHRGDGSSDSSWIQRSWVSPSQAWLGRGLGACMDLFSPQNLLGGSDGAKLGSSPPRVLLQKALGQPWLKSPPISACSGWSRARGAPSFRRGTSPGKGTAHPGPCQPLDGLSLGVADEIMVQSHVGLDLDHLLLGRLEKEVGAAVGLVGAVELWEML